MGGAKKRPTDARGWDRLIGRIAGELREKGIKAMPFPKELKTREDLSMISFLNAREFDPAGYSKEDVPTAAALREAGVSHYDQLRDYFLFKVRTASSKKRKGVLDAEKELKRLRGERPLDKKLFGNDVEAREAAMKAAAWDDKKKKVTMELNDFTGRGGCKKFWVKLKDDERAAKVRAAEVAESLRR